MKQKFSPDFYKNNLEEYIDTEIYDLENTWGEDDYFYLNEAKENQGKILDIGCGTGRLTRRLEKYASKIIGLDIQPEMLLKAKKESTSEKITWIESDCRNFTLGLKFDLIVMTSHVFQHLLTTEDQISLFKNVRQHLENEGKFIFDTRSIHNISYGIHREYTLLKRYKNINDELIEMYLKNAYDIKTQLDCVQIKRINTSSSKEKNTTIYLKYTTIEILNELLDNMGLEIIEQYGNWQKESYTKESKEIITICKIKERGIA